MLPVAPLMIEHRIIERMIGLIADEIDKLKKSNPLTPIFIDTAVDFIRVYADQTHHGKEEDILFRELKKKQLSPDHQRIMNELIEEHKISRKTTGELVTAKDKFFQGHPEALTTIIEKMEFLSKFYPVHIEKEDKRFFTPIMKYFTKEEQEAMLMEGQVYDRKMIHRKYDKVVGDLEKSRNIAAPKRSDNWLDFF